MTMTANPPAAVDSRELTVTRTITIAAPIEKVWAAITEAKHIAGWLGQAAVLDVVAVGASGVFSFDGYGDVPVRIEELDPPKTIVYRWCNDDARGTQPTEVDDDHSTVFRFTLEPRAEGTQLTVVESGFGTTTDPTFNLESHRKGWDAELDELVDYLEGGS